MSLSIEEQRNKIREIKNIEIESKKSKINKKNFKNLKYNNYPICTLTHSIIVLPLRIANLRCILNSGCLYSV